MSLKPEKLVAVVDKEDFAPIRLTYTTGSTVQNIEITGFYVDLDIKPTDFVAKRPNGWRRSEYPRFDSTAKAE